MRVEGCVSICKIAAGSGAGRGFSLNIPLPPGCGEILKCTDPVSVLERLGQVPELSNRVRLIPYSAVGVGSGLLPVFRPDSLMVDGKIRDGVLIAAAPALDNGGDYDAVL